MKPKTVIAVVGPTAIGKTELAITIAKQLGTEIISADSRQFFKEMEIGTAVPSAEELQTVPHHFIQHKSIQDAYSVGDFERDADKKLQELFKNYDQVIMVGGSGLYVDAIIHGLDEFPEVDPKIRELLNKKLSEKGLESLQKELYKVDPKYHEMVDVHNPHRLIRALEIYHASGWPYSSFLNQKKKKKKFKSLYIGIQADREIIYDRINQRVDLMMESGLLDEAKKLYPFRNLNALQTVGYKELFSYFDGDFTLDFAISEIKKNTRRFAKRQLTWLRKNEEIIWVDSDIESNSVMDRINQKLVSNHE
ncbi:tRNA (adenosine(37)-N6)-dimethylallyltransferase MiaA [Flagellimonas flava]|uniref:tRNA dimethylallyltransferase n=1 Tax=Flagellimonas flava TaxID=570519 RepID=A0A1M5I9W4_9FLAO|nr:tRNA (adenosine(37)-N6)-dimethylallyltransferase MiaA [Allomuricauda flava]SHG25052.1 tRNA dimethylallyltransferase [Allomuricauda flava]